MSEYMQIKRSDVQALLDLATNSMDYGSGFWDMEDVDPARRVAEALGIDPSDVTPHNLQGNFPHAFTTYSYNPNICSWCSRGKDYPKHE